MFFGLRRLSSVVCQFFMHERACGPKLVAARRSMPQRRERWCLLQKPGCRWLCRWRVKLSAKRSNTNRVRICKLLANLPWHEPRSSTNSSSRAATTTNHTTKYVIKCKQPMNQQACWTPHFGASFRPRTGWYSSWPALRLSPGFVVLRVFRHLWHCYVAQQM